uniref:SH2 domain-containing protein 4A n=1 Tax=Ditylenchus dipsaci TaxID=166011 RepID=A0A915EC97_9BILA
MSALQDILDKMYVDPELLEQLGEEQKQILFIKMREEQLRRWRDNEARVEQEQKNGSGQLPKKNRRGIKWLTGKDGEVWTWVMGDHPADMTIEQIIDKEAQEQARKIAEKEVLLESFSMDVPFLMQTWMNSS